MAVLLYCLVGLQNNSKPKSCACMQEPQHNSSTPVPSAKPRPDMRDRPHADSKFESPGNATSPSVATMLNPPLDRQALSSEVEHRQSKEVPKPASSKTQTAGPSLEHASSGCQQQSRLEPPQLPTAASGNTEQEQQQRVSNGPANRHLNEEADAEDIMPKSDDSASETSDLDEEDLEEEDEDESAESIYQVGPALVGF